MKSDRWDDLVALAERELELVREERWDEVAALGASRLRAATALGAPPAAARPALERLAELQHDILAGIATGRAFTLRKLAELQRGHAAVRGYAGGRTPHSVIDGRA